MEGAIKTVVSVFLKSAKGKENLGEKDFQSLVKNQLKNIMTDTDSSKAIKDMRQGLDSNQDGKVSFQEYMTLIGYLANGVSQQHGAETDVKAASSTQNEENNTEAAAASNAEPEAAKVTEPVKEEVPVQAKEEVAEVVEVVELAEDENEEVERP